MNAHGFQIFADFIERAPRVNCFNEAGEYENRAEQYSAQPGDNYNYRSPKGIRLFM